MSNKGIIVSGGQFNVSGPMAVGDHATANSYGIDQQRELSEKLDRLLDQIRNSELPAERRHELAGVVGEMQQQAASPKPDKGKMERGLSLIDKAASSVSGIATAVKVVRDVVALFLF